VSLIHHEALRRGAELFNAGAYFAAHEVWEAAWRQSVADEKILLQGLIQAAAAMLHAERGNRSGAERLHARACTRLRAIPSDFGNLEVARLAVELDEFITRMAGGDRCRRPRLSFAGDLERRARTS
jgi:predicted metal-dependent hydrolase